MSLSDPRVIYLAGMIDGDGYISINRCVRKGIIYHAPVIGISGTRREPHDLAAELWGGNVWTHTPANRRHRSVFLWARQGDGAIPAITAVMPYLLIKKRNAEIALELHEDILDGRAPDPYPWHNAGYSPIPYREKLREEMVQVLNQGRRMP